MKLTEISVGIVLLNPPNSQSFKPVFDDGLYGYSVTKTLGHSQHRFFCFLYLEAGHEERRAPFELPPVNSVVKIAYLHRALRGRPLVRRLQKDLGLRSHPLSSQTQKHPRAAHR